MKRYKLNTTVNLTDFELHRTGKALSAMSEDTSGEWVLFTEHEKEVERIKDNYWEHRVEKRIRECEDRLFKARI